MLDGWVRVFFSSQNFLAKFIWQKLNANLISNKQYCSRLVSKLAGNILRGAPTRWDSDETRNRKLETRFDFPEKMCRVVPQTLRWRGGGEGPFFVIRYEACNNSLIPGLLDDCCWYVWSIWVWGGGGALDARGGMPPSAWSFCCCCSCWNWAAGSAISWPVFVRRRTSLPKLGFESFWPSLNCNKNLSQLL